jgi:hypothetical protein
MAVPIISHGATVVFGTSGFTARLVSISGPRTELAKAETSYQGSTYMVREYIPGLQDPGELSMEIIFDPDDIVSHEPFSVQYMAGGWAVTTGTTETVTITWPKPYNKTSGATLTVTGFISGFEITADHGEAMRATVTVSLTGPLVWAASA